MGAGDRAEFDLGPPVVLLKKWVGGVLVWDGGPTLDALALANKLAEKKMKHNKHPGHPLP